MHTISNVVSSRNLGVYVNIYSEIRLRCTGHSGLASLFPSLNRPEKGGHFVVFKT